MLTKNESDLIWKIRHGAIPTGRFLYGCKYSDSPNYMFGGILLVSQLVLVLMLMLDAYATGFLRRQKLQLYIVDSTNTRVVGLNV